MGRIAEILKTFKMHEGAVNWVWPSKAELEDEWKTENLDSLFAVGYPSAEDNKLYKKLFFGNLKKISKIESVKESQLDNNRLDYYKAKDIKTLKKIISHMGKDVDGIVKAFESKNKLSYPLIMKSKKDGLKTLGGRTRMSVAFILGFPVEAIVIDKKKFINDLVLPIKHKKFLSGAVIEFETVEAKQAVLDVIKKKIKLGKAMEIPELKNLGLIVVSQLISFYRDMLTGENL